MATNHTLFNTQSVNREQVSIVGRFTAGGTGVVTLPKGRGYSVTRVSTGVLLVTLADSYPTVVYQAAGIVASTTASDLQIQCSPVSAKSMTISAYSITTGAAALTDVPNGYQVHFRVDALNSSVP